MILENKLGGGAPHRSVGLQADGRRNVGPEADAPVAVSLFQEKDDLAKTALSERGYMGAAA